MPFEVLDVVGVGYRIYQGIIVNDWNKGTVIGDEVKTSKSFQVLAKLPYRPSWGQTFQLDHCVSCFS